MADRRIHQASHFVTYLVIVSCWTYMQWVANRGTLEGTV